MLFCIVKCNKVDYSKRMIPIEIKKLAKKIGLSPQYILDVYTRHHDFSKVKIKYSEKEFYKDSSVDFCNRSIEFSKIIEQLQQQNADLLDLVSEKQKIIDELKGVI